MSYRNILWATAGLLLLLSTTALAFDESERKTFTISRTTVAPVIMTHGDPGSNDNNSLVGVDYLYRDTDGPFGQIVTGNFWAQQSKTTGIDGDDRAFGALFEMPNDLHRERRSATVQRIHVTPG